MKSHFVYKRRIHFGETDAMGVMHHSNHVHLFEESRVEYMRKLDVLRIHVPYGELIFAVTELNTRYLRPVKFDEEVAVHVQCRSDGVRVRFRYAVWSVSQNAAVAEGETVHAPVGVDLKLRRLPREVRERVNSQRWDEEWPPKSPADFT